MLVVEAMESVIEMAIIVTLPGALVGFIAALIKVFLLDGTALQGVATYFTVAVAIFAVLFVAGVVMRLARPVPARTTA